MAQGKKPKPKKLTINSKTTWRNILKDVEKKEVPVHVLESLTVHLKDGTLVTIDIKGILAESKEDAINDEKVFTKKYKKSLQKYLKLADFYKSTLVIGQGTDRNKSSLGFFGNVFRAE